VKYIKIRLNKIAVSTRRKLRPYLFRSGIFSALINPYYLIRSGLYKAIKKNSNYISGNIIDIGCGEKPYEFLFRNSISYSGVDIEVSGHDHTNSKIDFYYDGITLPFPDKTFDAAVCFEVLEHIPNPNLFIMEIERIVKPGGRIMLTTPLAWEEHEVPYDYHRFTAYGLCNLFELGGFKVDSVERTTTHFVAIFQLIIAYLSLYLFSRSFIIKVLTQITIIFPLTIICLALNNIMPKNQGLYCNLIILAEKPFKD
jgi:SAM-dependent methyltransferase